jgi:alpha-L-fucosidase
VVKPNLRELLTNYGPIGLIWFDTPVAISRQQSESLRDFVHELQPECLVSGRGWARRRRLRQPRRQRTPRRQGRRRVGNPGHAQRHLGLQDRRPQLEVRRCPARPAGQLRLEGRELPAECGPDRRGRHSPAERRSSARSASGSTATARRSTARSASPLFTTRRGVASPPRAKLYLLIKQWPTDGLQLCGLLNKVTSARVLGAANGDVPVAQQGDTVTLTLPAEAPEETVSVVELTVAGTPEAEQLIIQQGAAGIEFPVPLADVEGDLTVHRTRGAHDWTDTKPVVSWPFRAKTAGTYEVYATTRVNKNELELYGNHTVQVSVDSDSIDGTVGVSDMAPPTDQKVFQMVRSSVGKVQLQPGDHVLKVTATAIDPQATHGLRLVKLDLCPVA